MINLKLNERILNSENGLIKQWKLIKWWCLMKGREESHAMIKRVKSALSLACQDIISLPQTKIIDIEKSLGPRDES